MRAFAYNINLRVADEGRDRRRPSRSASTRSACAGTGYAPDIDLGVAGDGSSPSAAAPAMEPVVIYPEDDHGVRVSGDSRAARPGVPGVRVPLRHAAAARWCSPATPAPCDNVVRLADGADVLVHEVIDVDRLADAARRPAQLRGRPQPPRRRPLVAGAGRRDRQSGRGRARWCSPTSFPATATRPTRSGRPGCGRTSTARSSAASTSTSSPSGSGTDRAAVTEVPTTRAAVSAMCRDMSCCHLVGRAPRRSRRDRAPVGSGRPGRRSPRRRRRRRRSDRRRPRSPARPRLPTAQALRQPHALVARHPRVGLRRAGGGTAERRRGRG